jgi:hypothetical protein
MFKSIASLLQHRVLCFFPEAFFSAAYSSSSSETKLFFTTARLDADLDRNWLPDMNLLSGGEALDPDLVSNAAIFAELDVEVATALSNYREHPSQETRTMCQESISRLLASPAGVQALNAAEQQESFAAIAKDYARG